MNFEDRRVTLDYVLDAMNKEALSWEKSSEDGVISSCVK
jgi:hypothetical protein